MVIGGNVGRVVIDKSHFLFGRRYTYRSHSRSIHSEKAAPLAFESVRGKQVSRNWPLENKNLVYACDRHLIDFRAGSRIQQVKSPCPIGPPVYHENKG